MADTTEFKTDTIVYFLGYTGELDPSAPLKEGDVLKIIQEDNGEGILCNAPFISAPEYCFETEIRIATDEEIAASWVQAERDQAASEVVEEAEQVSGEAAADTTEATTEVVTEAAPAKGKGGKAAKAQTKKERVAETVANDPNINTDTDAEETTAIALRINASESMTVDQIKQLDGDAVLEAAVNLVEANSHNQYQLGGVLAHIYSAGLFKRLGYDGKRAFANYLDEKLGMNYRKAMYLIDLYETFTRLGVSEERLATIGWSKAKEFISAATPDNIDTLIEYAATHTRNEVVDFVKSEMVDASDGSNRVEMTKFSFSVTKEAAANIEAGLATAKSQCNSDKTGDQFEFIVSEWRQMNSGIEVPLDDAISILEAKYGVKLVIDESVDESYAPNLEREEGEEVVAAE